METGMVLLLAVIVIYALISLWLGKLLITMPMVFVLLGALFGIYAIGWIQFSLSTKEIESLVEVRQGLLLIVNDKEGSND